MVEHNGVYTISCEVNGMKSRMVFDTGASKVSLSNTFCEILLDNGFISKSDFVGQGKMLTADGRIVDHAELLLRTIKIGDIVLRDVPAIVVNSQNAPMLFGQSAIQLLGDVSIKGDKLYVKDGKDNSSTSSTNTHFEKWDANHYSYSNYIYGFGWDLLNDIKWEKSEGQEKHTVFRAEGPPFTVFVNAQVADKENDLWVVYDQFTAALTQIDDYVEKKTGLMAYERTFEKCTLMGQHAIKTTFKEYFKDSRFEIPRENYAEEYMVVSNGYIFTIAVKIPKEIYDQINQKECKETFSEIFKGFRFTVKH